MSIKMSQVEFEDARESYQGFCTECNEITIDGGVEPDATDYYCDSCGNDTVVGMEEALLMGEILLC